MTLTKSLTQKQRSFIYDFAQLNTSSAIPQSTLYVLAYLTVCTEAEQSAFAIMQSLELSSGSVSTALNTLMNARLVNRIKRKGERQPYYYINPEGWTAAIRQRLDAIHNMRLLAEKASRMAPTNERVLAMHQTYALFDEKLQAILQS